MSLLGMGLSIGTSLLGGILGGSAASAEQRKAEGRERDARAEMERMKNMYSNLDTSNPYLNMENTMEDLTINQQQAQFQREQFQQSQANIMNTMRGAAGGSGIGAVAQALAQQGQLQAQQASAGIGAQEAQNQLRRPQMAAQLQAKERAGEVYSRGLERDTTSTLLGMSQADVVGAQAQVAAAKKAKADAWSGAFGGISGALTAGIGSGAFGGGGRKQYSETPKWLQNQFDQYDPSGNTINASIIQ